MDTGAQEVVVPLSYEKPNYDLLEPDIRVREPSKKMLDIHGMQTMPIRGNDRETIENVYLVHVKASIERSPLPEDQFKHLYRGYGTLEGDYRISL